jgi:hypothetical protein
MKAALLQHFSDCICIARDVGRIAGDVWQRKQLRKAAHGINFMLLTIFPDSIANCRWRVVLRGGDCGEQAQCSREHCPSILFQHGCNDKADSDSGELLEVVSCDGLPEMLSARIRKH